MAPKPTHRSPILAICLIVAICAVDAGTEHAGPAWWPHTRSAPCDGSIAECLAAIDGGGELDMESETSRRILATKSYISYGALQKNTVPCSRRGASYYNCKTGAQSNPYSRGCSSIARCRS